MIYKYKVDFTNNFKKEYKKIKKQKKNLNKIKTVIETTCLWKHFRFSI